MALTSTQQASRLFKKSLGLGETVGDGSKEFFNEAYLGNNQVITSQIWAESADIPNTADIFTSADQIIGIVQYKSAVTFTVVPQPQVSGRDVSYFSTVLKNIIPFNYGDGTSYNYKLYHPTTNALIPAGATYGDWLFDSNAGVLTWYTPAAMPSGIDATHPPKMTAYKYVGLTGLTSISGDITSLSTAISTEGSTRSSVDTSLSTRISTEESVRSSVDTTKLNLGGGTMTGNIDMSNHQIIISGSPTSNFQVANKAYVDAVAQGVAIHAPVHVVATGQTTLNGAPQTIDGHSVVEGDFALIAGQTQAKYNGIYVVSGGTWLRRTDADGLPTNEIELGDFVFVQSGVTNGNTGWAIGSTDAPTGQTYIIPDFDSQNWFKIAAPGTYSTDGQGIELTGTVFSLELSGSTLEKSSFGLRLNNTLSSAISSNTTSISTEISDRSSADTSLTTRVSTEESTRTSNVTSLTTRVSTEESTRTSNDTSLTTRISTEESVRTSRDNSLSTAILNVDLSSLSTAISTEESVRSSADNSLSTAIKTVSGTTENITDHLTVGDLIFFTGTTLSGTTNLFPSLSTRISTEESVRSSVDNSLSTAISGITGGGGTYDTTLGTLAMPSTVGGILSGTLANTLSGKSFTQMFDDLLFPTVGPYITTTNYATIAGYTATTPVEVGISYSPATTATYYPSNIINGNGSVGPAITGGVTGYTFFYTTTGGTVIEALFVTTTNPTGRTYTSRTIALGANTWSVAAHYSSGVGVGLYYNNKGTAVTTLDGSRVAGTKIGISSTVNGYRYVWYGSGAIGSVPVDGAAVRASALSKTFLSTTYTGTFTITIPAGNKEIYFFTPSGRTLSSVLYTESSSADVKGTFTPTSFPIADANGSTAISYVKYMATITGYGDIAHYVVTIT